MSHWKWRETKQHPSRARSGHQISCSFVSLHFLCDILAPITVVPSTTPNHLDALIIKCAAAPHNWARAAPFPRFLRAQSKLPVWLGPEDAHLLAQRKAPTDLISRRSLHFHSVLQIRPIRELEVRQKASVKVKESPPFRSDPPGGQSARRRRLRSHNHLFSITPFINPLFPDANAMRGRAGERASERASERLG